MNEDLQKRMELNRAQAKPTEEELMQAHDARLAQALEHAAWCKAAYAQVVEPAWTRLMETLPTYAYFPEDAGLELRGGEIRGELIVSITSRRAAAARVRLITDQEGHHVRLRGAGHAEVLVPREGTEQELFTVLLDLCTRGSQVSEEGAKGV